MPRMPRSLGEALDELDGLDDDLAMLEYLATLADPDDDELDDDELDEDA